MEANRDAASQSLTVAARAKQDGDLHKALKFARKSNELFPTHEAALMMTQVEATLREASKGGSAAAPEASQAERRPTSTTSASSCSGDQQQTSATQPQSELVRRILSANSFYDVLSVPWNVEETEIRKAFRKLAILLHPDKNNSPGAEEAFKKVRTASQRRSVWACVPLHCLKRS